MNQIPCMRNWHWYVSALVVLFGTSVKTYAQVYTLTSPNRQLEATIQIKENITWSVAYGDQPVVSNANVWMALQNGIELGRNPKVVGVDEKLVTETISAQVPTKHSQWNVSFNELTLKCKGNYALQLRAYDYGLAYRFVTSLGRKQEVIIHNERLDLTLPKGSWSYFPKEESLYSHFEQHHEYQPLDSIPANDFCALPVRFDVPGGVGLLVAEADLQDYPALFLEKNEQGFQSKFPGYVTKAEPLLSRPDRSEVLTTGDFIARTTGTRTFPWRVFMISADDRDFIANDLVFQLSGAAEEGQFDWVKPGKIAWDWYNANNIYGVDFESGINNDTYKYYIDFASKYGLEYVILDEGWTKTTTNVLESNPDIDVPELVAYANERGVGLILWLLWHPLDKNMDEILQLYGRWGVKGIKVDFMQRADQYMVNSYERIARVAAKYELMVDFHGAFKPAGLRARYPNVMTYEGVLGNENNKWSELITPEHNVTIPFTRMVAGPMDYTPGAMANAQERNFHISFNRPMSQGTRCHQAAMYVVYESPLQMLCDAPSAYMADPDFTEVIAQIPADWEETHVLEGKIADYVVVARRKGDTWYIGAMTDWSARVFTIDLSFLEDGAYDVVQLQDGVNAAKFSEDYQILEAEITNRSKLEARLAPGGGWVAVISPKGN